jgi:ribosomal protein L11 methyltransferase
MANEERHGATSISMRHSALWRVSIATSAEAEDAASELLAETFGQPVSSYRDFETGRTRVTAYLPRNPGRNGSWRTDLQERVRRARACGLDLGPAQISLARVRWEYWAESWKRHFKPLMIGPALMVKPSWCRVKPLKGQAVVVLDPGLSFGTGHHPTTAFCLQQIVKRRQPEQRQSFLDVGTGSGILAIAAARLGYGPVHAFDNDSQAVRVARANARKNGVANQVRFARQDLESLSLQPGRKHSLICANLISNLLLRERQRILPQLQPGGLLVLAGILKEEFPRVKAAYEASGLRMVASRAQHEWRSGAFANF